MAPKAMKSKSTQARTSTLLSKFRAKRAKWVLKRDKRFKFEASLVCMREKLQLAEKKYVELKATEDMAQVDMDFAREEYETRIE